MELQNYKLEMIYWYVLLNYKLFLLKVAL